jgi:hypothetical protein
MEIEGPCEREMFLGLSTKLSTAIIGKEFRDRSAAGKGIGW